MDANQRGGVRLILGGVVVLPVDEGLAVSCRL